MVSFIQTLSLPFLIFTTNASMFFMTIVRFLKQIEYQKHICYNFFSFQFCRFWQKLETLSDCGHGKYEIKSFSVGDLGCQNT